MIAARAFENEITLLWKKEKTKLYNVYIGETKYETNKTHFTFKNLLPDTDYSILITDKEGKTEIFKQTVRTKREAARIDITKAPYFAAGDGKSINTKKIQSAIDDCPKGGCVYVPSGTFLTGALTLHSDMTLFIEDGGTLLGTADPKDYLPKIKSRFEGIERMCYSSLLNMGTLNRGGDITCRNVTICGGTIEGGGRTLAENIIDVETENMKDYLEELGDKIKEYEFPKTIPGRARPRLINISSCENITLCNTNIKNGPGWNVHMVYSRDIVTFSCSFYSHEVWNGDGWDPDSSENCAIFDCTFDTGDDCIAIKSGKNPEGNIINKPCKNIYICDCKSIAGHGIAVGSEMSGGVCGVYVWDCDFAHSTVGVELKATKKRGGYICGIHISDSILPRVIMRSVLYNDDGEPAPSIPYFENITVEDTSLTGIAFINDGTREECPVIEMRGFDEKCGFIKNVLLRNIEVLQQGAQKSRSVVLQNVCGVTIENIKCN